MQIASGLCQVIYTVRSQWQDGFTTDVTVKNTGASAINGWTLTFTFPGAQRVTQGWSATWTQSGANVSAQNLDWNANLSAGASTTIGFTGAYTDSNPSPSSYKLNGVTCSAN
jgi:cellulase/cellobiase CelA1